MEAPLLAGGLLALAFGRRKNLSQTPGLEERRKAAPDRADPEREAASGIREWGLTGMGRRGTNREPQQLCRRSLMPAPHLFFQLVSSFLDQFHELPDDVILCKRAWVPPLLSTQTVSRSGLPRRMKPAWVPRD